MVLSLMLIVTGTIGGLMMPKEVKAASTGFYVSGTSIKDANGNDFVMRGVNIAHAWYTDKTEASIKGAAKLGSNVVRVVVADGAQYSKTSYSELQNIVKLCKDNKLVCILEVHDATGKDSTSDLDKAVDYWIENKSILQGNEKYVILNIANEWYGTWNGKAWADGNKNAVKKVRNAGIKNMIMIDCAGWGQYPASIKDYGKEVFNADTDRNTVFSIHMYEYAGGDASTVRTNIDNSLGIGVPVVIGEFGAEHTNGDVAEQTILDYCTQKGVGYLGWSWKGNSPELQFLDIVNDWDGNSLTSWGNTLINGSNGIKATAKTCSVFGGSSSNNNNSNNNNNNSSNNNNNSSNSSSSYVSLFWGTAEANSWDQAVSVATTRAGGSFNPSNVKKGGSFYVEYSGTKNKVELILQSYSGGPDWAKVSISESGSANGHYYAKFSYDNCVKAFGTSDFAGKLDRVHVGAAGQYVKVYSLTYDYGTSSSNNNSNSSSNNNNNSNNSSNNTTSSWDSLFWGKASASNWNQAVSIDTAKNGGKFQGGNVKKGGHFYVEYTGTQKKLDLVLQSWSGAAEWAKVTMTSSGKANGHYYATYSYNNCVKAFGSSDFANKLDRVHVSAAGSDLTVYSVCYDFGN